MIKREEGFFQIVAVVVLMLALIGIVIGLNQIRNTQTLKSKAAQENGSDLFKEEQVSEKTNTKVPKVGVLRMELYQINNFTVEELPIGFVYNPSLTDYQLRKSLSRTVNVRILGIENSEIEKAQNEAGGRLPYIIYQCTGDEIVMPITLAGPCVAQSQVVLRGNNDGFYKYPTAEISLIFDSRSLEELVRGDTKFKYYLLISHESAESEVVGIKELNFEIRKVEVGLL